MLPPEIIGAIIDAIADNPVFEASCALRQASLLSSSWAAVAGPRLAASPALSLGDCRSASSFIRELRRAVAGQAAEASSGSSAAPPGADAEGRREPRSPGLARLRKVQFVGRPIWRHPASLGTRPEIVSEATLATICDLLKECPDLHTLVFNEIPYSNFAKPETFWPRQLRKVAILSPLVFSNLVSMAIALPQLQELCIGSCEPRHDTMQLLGITGATSPWSLRSFGIVARTAESWFKDGQPWEADQLNWVLDGSISSGSLEKVHLEMADQDDMLVLFAQLGKAPSFKELHLRHTQPRLLAFCLDQCTGGGLKRLHLSSIYGTGLRSISPVWDCVPRSIEHLSVDVSRFHSHGPWNSRSMRGLADKLAALVGSGRCGELRTMGSMFCQDLRYAPEAEELKLACASQGVAMIPSTWEDSFVPLADGALWF